MLRTIPSVCGGVVSPGRRLAGPRQIDIRLLVEHFVEKFARQQHKAIHTIPEDVMGALESHHWPGNIRELQNVVERGVIVTTGSTLSRQTVQLLILGDVTADAAPQLAIAAPAPVKTLADAERVHITRTLRETKWVIGGRYGAAAQLGLPRTTLLSRMNRLGIPSAPLQVGPAARTVRAMEAVTG
jgi:formate hydrogenlyase transcriptional activator